MKCYKKIFKKIRGLLLILILAAISLSSMTVNIFAFELNSNSAITYNALVVGKTAYSAQDLNSILKNGLEQRQTSFNVGYEADTTNLKNIIETAIDGILKADDYLESSIISYECSFKGYENDVTINFTFEFYTTKIQEDYVNSQVTAILKDIIKISMNDDQKEKVIHDYIVSHVAYDTTITKFSAYEALKNGTTVCSGYAQLAYKMLNEAGIETKIVLGKGNGEDHAWNLVKLNNIWYHLDCTWDDPVPDKKGRVIYNYFNLNDKTISADHIFVKSDYPVANQVYQAKTAIFAENGFEKYTNSTSNTGVMTTKQWNINFNKGIDELSLKDNIFICKQGTKDYFPIILQVSEDRKSVKILHDTPFQLGGIYTLYICKDIIDVNGGVNLNTPIKIGFTISN